MVVVGMTALPVTGQAGVISGQTCVLPGQTAASNGIHGRGKKRRFRQSVLDSARVRMKSMRVISKTRSLSDFGETKQHEKGMRGKPCKCTPHEAALSTNIHQQQEISLHAPASEYTLSPSTGGGNDGGGSPPKDKDRWESSGNDPSPSGGTWFHPLALLLNGVRGRLEADPYFAHKLLIECGLDAAIIVSVNVMARKERFLKELEFTLCQLAISLFSDFAIVYLLAPSTTRPPPITGTLRAKLRLNALPAHVFQFSPAGSPPFTIKSRLATFLLKGTQYGAVGMAMGALGAACVHGLIRVRESVDPTFIPPETVQSILGTGAVWSGFMATSSNIRYNVLTICEDIFYLRGPIVGQMGSFALRLINNWAGAAQWVAVTRIHNIDEEWIPASKRLC